MSPLDTGKWQKADWDLAASKITPSGKAYIDGKFVDAISGKTFASINPATDNTLAMVAECDTADIDRAVAAARRAFEVGVWSRWRQWIAKRCCYGLPN